MLKQTCWTYFMWPHELVGGFIAQPHFWFGLEINTSKYISKVRFLVLIYCFSTLLPIMPLALLFQFSYFYSTSFIPAFLKSLFDLSLLFLLVRKFSVLQCNCMSCLLLHLSEHASACLQPERFEIPQ